MRKLSFAEEISAIILMVLVGSVLGQSQNTSQSFSGSQAWEIPFASADNTISLSVQNNSNIDAKNVSVTFTNLPSWLKFKSNTAVLKSVPAKGSGDAEFIFSVDKEAPIGKDTPLAAVIKAADGQSWTKNITVSVGAPRDYELYNNFPNPFNPSTRIAFELPKATHVNLTIYDVLGREVAEIADQNYPAGYSEVEWNGLNRNGEQVSSGVYLYRISTDKWTAVKKMMMLR